MTTNDRSGGYVLQAVLRISLLLAIVGQVVFLASRYRTRVDLTSDRLFTLTDSTRRVLSGLDDRLLIEAYFSADSNLSPVLRERRRALDNFLDEMVQLSNGKVVVQRFDPHDDNMIRERATRLGIQGITIGDQGDAAFAFKEIWQGLRMMYGADRQDTVPFVDFFFQSPAPTAMWEALLTPKVKALTVAKKPKIGLLAYATEAGPGGAQPFGGRGGQSQGYTELPRVVEGHYELQNIDLNEGQLVPAEIEDLIVIRPKNLTDRQKYAIDQFLMRGGNLVVFADTSEVEIGERRIFRGRKVAYDAGDAKLKFLDQLAHYGAKVEEKVIAEGLGDARRTEAFRIPLQTYGGQQPSQPLDYPYWFHALQVNWADYAKEIARMSAGANGNVDELATKYSETFLPGLAADNYMLKAMGRGPGMFWACPVGLAEKLPEGVTGQVLMRTSPVAYAEEPPPDFNPVGMSMDERQMIQSIQTFETKVRQKLMSEPRQQFDLMVTLSGPFNSFFEGKEIPPRATPDAQTAVGPQPGPLPVDPLALPISESPIRQQPPPPKTPESPPKTSGQESGAEPPSAPPSGGEPAKRPPGTPEEQPGEASETPEPAEAKKPGSRGGDGADGGAASGARRAQEPQEPQEPAKKPEQPPQESGQQQPIPAQEPQPQPQGQEPGKAEAAPAVEPTEPGATPPQEPQPAPEQGPPMPGAPPVEVPKEEDPEPVFQAPPTARVIVIGDADFIRDDLLRVQYGHYGPTSFPVGNGAQFLVNLVDWLAEDQDLLDLRNKTAEDRRLQFADDTLIEQDRETYAAQVKAREKALTFLNVGGPFAAILVIWLGVSLLRRARKQSFLATVQS